MSQNPLQQFFRQPALYLTLPTKGKWYTPEIVEMTDENQIAVYPLSAINEIMLNTPDAMLNGQALENVIKDCAPSIKNAKRFMLPDLEALFVAIKSASNNGKMDYDRNCPSCNHENSYELQCQTLLDLMTSINDDDLTIRFGDDLLVHVTPYDFEMRQIFMRREFEEEKLLRQLNSENAEIDELLKAGKMAESVERLSRITFSLVSRSIEKVIMLKTQTTVTNRDHINEWLMSISKQQADLVIESVDKINKVGVMKTMNVQCTSCGHTWEDALSFDPSSFFGRRS
jgi:DNA-directed RNA polymerase subunit M/transcription elongation factor TFIIS